MLKYAFVFLLGLDDKYMLSQPSAKQHVLGIGLDLVYYSSSYSFDGDELSDVAAFHLSPI